MAVKIYAVLLHVSEKDLGTVLSALGGSSTLISVTATQESAAHPNKSPTKNFHFHGGKRNKGISGEDLALQVLGSSDRIFNMSEINHAFVQHGFAGNSASPVLSRLASVGKVRALGAGRFCLPGTTHKL